MKKIIYLLLFVTILTTGCFKWDKMEDIDIITTIYPIEYVTNKLYGNYSNISSIYPKESDVNKYTLTAKQIKDFSNKDLFIYNGESNEKEYATSMLNSNKSLKIIDAAYGLDGSVMISDVWLNPSNILMIAQNIKNELEGYVSSVYIKTEINDNYDALKVDVSELETEFKKAADNSADVRIITSDESLKFLEKYGFEIINLTEGGSKKENNIALAESLLKNKKLSYIFIHENDSQEVYVDTFIKEHSATKVTFRTLATITDNDVTNNDDYLSLMHKNIELLKAETYK